MSSSVTHDTFVIERTYDSPPSRVFAAWGDQEAKQAWFAPPEDFESEPLELDFRVGGRERSRGGPKGGPVYAYECDYRDIVPDQRIVTTSEMYMDEQRISVSVSTIELAPAGDGTRLTLTDQGVYLDGLDDGESRRTGTEVLLDALGDYLAASHTRA